MLQNCLVAFTSGRGSNTEMMIEYQRVQRVRVPLVDMM